MRSEECLNFFTLSIVAAINLSIVKFVLCLKNPLKCMDGNHRTTLLLFYNNIYNSWIQYIGIFMLLRNFPSNKYGLLTIGDVYSNYIDGTHEYMIQVMYYDTQAIAMDHSRFLVLISSGSLDRQPDTT